MERAETISSTISIRHKFEELPLFWRHQPAEGDKSKVTWRGARVDGEFEVTYDMFDKDWYVSDVFVLVDNGQVGGAAKDDLVRLNADDDERFYLLLLDRITGRYNEQIEESIAEALADFENTIRPRVAA